jgi:hypothetical protein
MAEELGFDGGTPGASARREGARRRANRERRVRERHPRIGNLLLALQDAPQHEQAWDRGASGEEAVAASLARRCGDNVLFLHDRRIPGSRANIDHIAVTATGVWVIDPKRYKGKVEVHKPLFGEAKLTISGRDRSKLIDGLEKQVSLVRGVVGPDVEVHGALCMVDAELPMLGTLSFRGYPLLYPRGLAKRLNAAGPLERAKVRAVAEQLREHFPSA